MKYEEEFAMKTDPIVRLISRILLLFAISITIVFIINSCHPLGNEAGSKPNIILIMADDMGFSDPGFMGSGIQTPAIDRLAQNGLVFNQFYNAGRCCPTRASLMTGLYAHNTGLGWMTAADHGRPGYRGAISQHCVTIAEVLGNIGYATYMTGKWHLVYEPNMEADGDKKNWPLQRGFDKYFGMLAGGGGYYKPSTLTYNNTRICPADGFYLTKAINDSTISFLEQHLNSGKDQPFFFYVAHYAPHRPLHAMQEDIQKYKGAFHLGWDHFRQQHYARLKETGLAPDGWKLDSRPDDIPAWDSINEDDKQLWECRMEAYAAQIDRMDQGIARIINILEAQGELDNTLIMFLSDNGGGAASQGPEFFNPEMEGSVGGASFNQSYRRHWAHVSNAPFRLYKTYNHEGGISTPLIVHWPNEVGNPSIVPQQGHVIDLMATLIDMTGANYPEQVNGISINELQGMSLLPAFRGETFDRGELFFEHGGNRAVIYGQWKLVAEGSSTEPYSKEWELYNLSQDRAESKDLIGQYPDIAKELEEKWNSWANANNVLPLDGRGWGVKIRSDINK